MRYFIFIFIIFDLCAQDQSYFEKFSFDTKKKQSSKSNYKWKANGPFYQIDLGGQAYKESLVLEKKDGEDWLHVYDQSKERIFSHQFDVNGKDSMVYKMTFSSLSPSSKVLIVYYYEGNASFLGFRGSVRLYFLSIDKRDLKTLKVFKGPIVWEEGELTKGQYFQRGYKINLVDLTGDGVREISISSNYTSAIYFYKGPGKWRKL